MAYVHRDYPEFSWSMGRLKMLEGCERRYYYNYYGGHNGWLFKATEEQKQTYLLKKLTNRYALSGEMVHKSIKEYIESEISTGSKQISDEIINTYIEKSMEEFNQNCYLSKKHGSGWNTKIKGFQMMQEFFYGSTFSAEQQTYMQENIFKCINNFMYSKTLNEMLSNEVEVIENDEAEIATFYCSGIKVYVKLDLLYKIGDKYIIVDWKTGKGEDADEMQVLLYSKYVSEKYGINISDIVCRLEYLKSNTSKEFKFEEEAIQDVESVILGSASAMIGYLEDAELNKAKPVESFALCEDDTNCKNCSFRRLCGR